MSKRFFYVSAIDGSRYTLLTGPYETHQEALDMVDSARDIAQKVDPQAVFYAFGTCRTPEGYEKPGVLNHLLGGQNEHDLLDGNLWVSATLEVRAGPYTLLIKRDGRTRSAIVTATLGSCSKYYRVTPPDIMGSPTISSITEKEAREATKWT